MAAATTAVLCTAGVWTPISTGNAGVAFEWREDTDYGKYHLGQTIPAVDTIHYKTLRPKAPQSLNDLLPEDIVWAMPFGTSDQYMEVLTP